jgi:hypothetical protein
MEGGCAPPADIASFHTLCVHPPCACTYPVHAPILCMHLPCACTYPVRAPTLCVRLPCACTSPVRVPTLCVHLPCACTQMASVHEGGSLHPTPAEPNPDLNPKTSTCRVSCTPLWSLVREPTPWTCPALFCLSK